MRTIIFRTTAHIITGVMLVFSVYLLFRGHNEPGGGFVGSLVAIIAFGVLILAESAAYVKERLRFNPMVISFFGIFLGVTSGLLSLLLKLPFLTGIWWQGVLLIGTPIIFDVGVYFAILGSVLGVLLRISEKAS